MSSGPPTLPTGVILGLKVILIDILVESLWLGVQGVVTVIGIYLLCSRGQTKSFGNRFLIGIILFLFFSSTCSLSLITWDYMNRVDGFNGIYDATPIINKVNIITMVFQRLSYFISDSIVVWRAWLLWNRNVFVKMLLVVCLMGTITASFVQGALSVHQQIRQTGGVSIGSGLFSLMFSIPLLFTNLASTTLIAAKIWEYRRDILNQLSTSKTRVFGVLLILLESSVLYCIFWILALLSVFPDIITPIGLSAIMGSLPYVTAIYPVMIVVLVTLGKNNYGSTIQATANTTVMRFNHTTTATVNSDFYDPENFHPKKRLSGDHRSSSS
ncbi:hypothetical protein BDP27DRAFT_1319345 [Rhodocollybia butyracea]|uniref:Uncharacterized protein n=1 Tax=Rhodocollybia butyracea TaxID=206335 RepID=A0A9P5PV83_9AGAR|nr:hypothetical protein BDP27DRAFT_1319345 [Rhodocollybia butyracea]